MLKDRRALVIAVVCAASCLAGLFYMRSLPTSSTSLSFQDLLDEMASLDGLAFEVPWPACRMSSSYDRTGGNEDKGQYDRILPNGRKLVLDAKGPGCVQRLWGTGMSANDRLLFFFDGETSPRLNASLRDLIYWQKRFPFVAPFRPDGSAVTYFPLPFEKSLRIEAEGPKPIYYQVTWRKFPKGTIVEAYPGTFTQEQTNMIFAAGEAWLESQFAADDLSLQWHTQSVAVASGDTASLHVPGRGVVRNFVIDFGLRDDDRILHHNIALRQTQLRVSWDGRDEPSVICPLGPFFCNAWRQTDFASQPMSSSNGVFRCRFPMPFLEGALFELKNGGLSQLAVTIKVGVSPLPDEKSEPIRYFHANWSSSQASGAERRSHTILRTRGKGHYVGCALSTESGQAGWLVLEGDETIRVDGEKTPSHLGTGLEDYFNDCWYYLHGLQSHPWHGLLEFVPYRCLQYRFHNVDAIPFRKSFDMTFERGHGSEIPARFESVAYWYQDRPAAAPEFSGTAVDCSACGVSEAEAMAALFSLERAGRTRDAVRLCRQFVQDHPTSAFKDTMKMRGLLYEAFDLGNTNVFTSPRATELSGSPLLEQARGVVEMMNRNDRAFVGFQLSTKGKLYLDGQPIAEVAGHLDYVGKVVDLAPGRHLLSIEVEPSGHERWVLTTVGNPSWVRGGAMDKAFYEEGWQAHLEKPTEWPLRSTTRLVSAVKTWPGTGLPRPPYVAFRPSIVPHMQAGHVMLIGADPHQRMKRIYLTKEFEWPGEEPIP